MTIFLENIWIWFGLAFVTGVLGYVTFLHDRRIRTLGTTLAVVVGILLLGLGLYCFVDTDYKSVTRMLNSLVKAIESGNVDDVLAYIKEDAIRTRSLARGQMALVEIPSARFKDLNVVVNELTSPPIAKIDFVAVVYWRPRLPIEGFQTERPMIEYVKFDVELEKTRNQSWLVTDKCLFTPRAGM